MLTERVGIPLRKRVLCVFIFLFSIFFLVSCGKPKKEFPTAEEARQIREDYKKDIMEVCNKYKVNGSVNIKVESIEVDDITGYFYKAEIKIGNYRRLNKEKAYKLIKALEAVLPQKIRKICQTVMITTVLKSSWTIGMDACRMVVTQRSIGIIGKFYFVMQVFGELMESTLINKEFFKRRWSSTAFFIFQKREFNF